MPAHLSVDNGDVPRYSAYVYKVFPGTELRGPADVVLADGGDEPFGDLDPALQVHVTANEGYFEIKVGALRHLQGGIHPATDIVPFLVVLNAEVQASNGLANDGYQLKEGRIGYGDDVGEFDPG
ncbi:MAG: hypothetical protein AVO35_02395 [Candidatus Aegiribacteria sp. MLS_C]|nr:MAG: hypothetical protein AVO35_02395 [Candidatus Aegiribacteria sp. MLS_C]